MRLEEMPAITVDDARTSPSIGKRPKNPEGPLPPGPDRKTKVLVGGQESGGRLALIECRGTHGDALPLHIHHQEDEFLYVLEGQITVLLGEEEFLAPAGTALTLPRGVEHSFVVESQEARVLVVVSPAGFEGFLKEMDGPERDSRVGDDGHALERLICVAARYGMDITGPAPRATEKAQELRRTR